MCVADIQVASIDYGKSMVLMAGRLCFSLASCIVSFHLLIIGTLSPLVLSIFDAFMLRGLSALKKNFVYFVTKPPLWMFIFGQAMHKQYPGGLEAHEWLIRSVFIVTAHCLTVHHFSTQAWGLLTEMFKEYQAL